MRIWTIKEGEPLPIEGAKGRIMRCGIINQMLAKRGHDVTWWSSTFSHQLKEYIRSDASTEVISPNYRIRLLHSKTIYYNNVSTKRMKYHKELAAQFEEETINLKKPDAIFCSYPTIDFAYAAMKYGNDNNIPVVIDVRDFWPDIFTQPFPKIAHPFIEMALYKYYKMSKYTIQNADVVVGVNPSVFEWTKKKGRTNNDLDHTVFLAYDYASEQADLQTASGYWELKGLNSRDNIICYFGNIVKRVDFMSVINAAMILKERGVSCKFVICGTGKYLPELIKTTQNMDNFIFPGFIDQDRIIALMEIAMAGVLPYFNSPDFVDAVPNKAIEYLAGGLPVLSSLQGYLKNLLTTNGCGLTHVNSYELANNIEYLIKNNDVLMEMKYNAKNLYLREFTADIVYGDLCNFLEQIAKEHN